MIMPNWTYGTIVLENESGVSKMKELIEKGDGSFCVGLLPNPNENNWYGFNIANYGTKWGDRETDQEGDHIYFDTAWSPLSVEFLGKLQEVVGSFSYSYEEEQGWGGEFRADDLSVQEVEFYDIPNWEEVEIDGIDNKYDEITFLAEDYMKHGDVYVKGYYRSYGLEEFLGSTQEEVKENF